MLTMDRFKAFQNFYRDAYHEFRGYISSTIFLVDVFEDIDELSIEESIEYINTEAKEISEDEEPEDVEEELQNIIDTLSENDRLEGDSLYEDLINEIDNNSLSTPRLDRYYERIYYEGIFRLYLEYLDLDRKFTFSKAVLGDRLFDLKLSYVYKYFQKSLNTISMMVEEIYDWASRSGAKRIYEPYNLADLVFEQKIQFRIQGKLNEFLQSSFDENGYIDNRVFSNKAEENHEKFSYYLGGHASKLLPYLKRKYCEAKPKNIAILILALDKMQLINGLLKGNISNLHRMIKADFNENLDLRAFTNAIKHNNPNEPNNIHRLTHLKQQVQSVIKEIESELDT